MSRNRFKHTNSLHWAAVLKCLLIIGTMAFLGMTYVLMKNQILRVAHEVQELDEEDKRWKNRNAQLQSNIDRLTSYTVLQQRVNELGLGFVRIGELDVKDMGHGARYVQGVKGVQTPVQYQTETERRR